MDHYTGQRLASPAARKCQGERNQGQAGGERVTPAAGCAPSAPCVAPTTRGTTREMPGSDQSRPEECSTFPPVFINQKKPTLLEKLGRGPGSDQGFCWKDHPPKRAHLATTRALSYKNLKPSKPSPVREAGKRGGSGHKVAEEFYENIGWGSGIAGT